MKLHELSKEYINQIKGTWYVALKDTVDYRTGWGEIKKNFIAEKDKTAVIKEGEIVWHDKSKEQLFTIYGEGWYNIHPFNNHFEMNYLGEDFRELTPEEITQYIK